MKHGLGYKTRIKHYGLGIKDADSSIKRGLSITDSVQNTDLGMNSRLDYQPLLGKWASKALYYHNLRNRNFVRKEELIYETIAALTSNIGHLGWQHMRSFTKWQLWRQNTISLMHRDHLVGNPYFVTFFVFCTESVMLSPRSQSSILLNDKS